MGTILAKLGGIQKKFHEGVFNSFLAKLEIRLRKELDIIVFQEELMWFQKSRVKWLNDGDRNTKFYHMKAIGAEEIKF